MDQMGLGRVRGRGGGEEEGEGARVGGRVRAGQRERERKREFERKEGRARERECEYAALPPGLSRRSNELAQRGRAGHWRECLYPTASTARWTRHRPKRLIVRGGELEP